MASIKVKYRPSINADQEGTIYYQIIHERKVRQINTDYHIKPDEWDDNRSMVIARQTNIRKSFVLSVKEEIRRDIERLRKIVGRLDAERQPYIVDDVIDEFNRYLNECSLVNYMSGLIAKFRHNNKVRTSETYTAALNSFKKFLNSQEVGYGYNNDKDIMLDSITSEIMEAYEAWHKSRGNTPNTISFYNRIIRAVYNRAIEEGIIENRNPFRHVYTGVDRTVKRALPLPYIKKIKALDLSYSSSMDYARDMFLMSFYLRGMSFIDMAFLKKSDLKSGYIIYRRRKTGQQLTIEWASEMQAIIDKYPDNPTAYLLPIIKTKGINERCAYRNIGYNINNNLKKIAKTIGISIPLTMYVARHSWASIAKYKGIPFSVISDGLGHDSEATTRIYLSSLDTSLVDKANALIIKSI